MILIQIFDLEQRFVDFFRDDDIQSISEDKVPIPRTENYDTDLKLTRVDLEMVQSKGKSPENYKFEDNFQI